jgi:uncharacterized protein
MKRMHPALHGIEVPHAEIERFCGRNHIRKLSLFGSILTNRFRPESDIDVLVEFEAGAAVTYLDLARMERELSEIVGRKVDLRTPEELSRYFRERVVSEALLQYERK